MRSSLSVYICPSGLVILRSTGGLSSYSNTAESFKQIHQRTANRELYKLAHTAHFLDTVISHVPVDCPFTIKYHKINTKWTVLPVSFWYPLRNITVNLSISLDIVKQLFSIGRWFTANIILKQNEVKANPM